MKKLLIFPFNGNGLEALDGVDAGQYEFIGFVDDTIEKKGYNELGFQVFGREAFSIFPDAQVLAVPGSVTSFPLRENLISALNIPLNRFATVIHPKANISPLSKIGFNVLIMAGVCITANAKIADHVCILPNTVIHHDSIIGAYTLVGSNVTVAGQVTIAENCYIGSGSSIISGIAINKGALIGMGTNVLREVEPFSKVFGNPGRVIK